MRTKLREKDAQVASVSKRRRLRVTARRKQSGEEMNGATDYVTLLTGSRTKARRELARER